MTRQRAASRTDLNYTRGAFATGRLGNSLEVGRVNQEMLAESTRQASVYVTEAREDNCYCRNASGMKRI